MGNFILASASPRRKELLEQIGMKFDVLIADADETKVDKTIPVNLYVEELALIKAAAAAEMLNRAKDKTSLIISADTVVSCDGKILGKPKNEDDAVNMISMLSGREHEVYTGVCVMRMSDSFSVAGYEKTIVKFNDLSAEMIERYVKTKEYADKAGGYGIQGKGAVLVEKIDGDYSNVVGLPLSKLCKILENEFDEKII